MENRDANNAVIATVAAVGEMLLVAPANAWRRCAFDVRQMAFVVYGMHFDIIMFDSLDLVESTHGEGEVRVAVEQEIGLDRNLKTNLLWAMWGSDAL
jgi:hypothetical protein